MQSPDTSLSQLTSTNTPPTTGEAAFTCEQIEAIQSEIEDIKQQADALECVGAMDSRVDQLRSRIPPLKRRLRQYKSILSSCRRMPLEILGEVFSYISENTLLEALAQTLARLCQVCRSWRAAAFLVPGLWSRVSVSFAARGFSASALSEWLNRSRHLPRVLDLHSYPGCGSTRCRGGRLCQFSNPEVAKLLKNGPLLDTLTVSTQTPECFENFAITLQRFEKEGADDVWNTLRSLTISASGWNHWRNIPSSSFQFMPTSLTSLCLQLPAYESVSSTILAINILPEVLGRLISFELDCDWATDYMFRLLEHCSALEDLTITFRQGNGVWADLEYTLDFILGGRGGLVLPNVRKCRFLELRSEAFALNGLDILQLPALVDLEMTFGEEEEGGWCPISDPNDNTISTDASARVARFLRPSKSTLERLSISTAHFKGDALFGVLKDLEALTHLSLNSVFFGASLFKDISSSDRFSTLRAFAISGAHVGGKEGERFFARDFFQERRMMDEGSPCRLCHSDLSVVHLNLPRTQASA